MRFSILIPVYNTSAYLDQCMSSVLEQQFQDYEVILVDDGSTDNSGTMCDSYTKDPRVRVIHKENQGLLMARRTGIAEAKGEFCIFLDSDDALISGALERIHARLTETEADILIYNTALVYHDDFSAPHTRKPVFSEDRVFTGEAEKREIYQELLQGSRLNNLWLKAIRTPLVQTDDTDYEAIKDNSMGEDLIQSFYPITHAERIAYTRDCNYYYRQNAASMTRYVDPAKLERSFLQFNPNGIAMRLRYAGLWGMADDACLNGIYRASMRNMRDSFNSVFMQCPDADAQRKWCSFPWETLLPQAAMDAFNSGRIKMKTFEKMQLKAIFRHHIAVSRLLVMLKKLRG